MSGTYCYLNAYPACPGKSPPGKSIESFLQTPGLPHFLVYCLLWVDTYVMDQGTASNSSVERALRCCSKDKDHARLGIFIGFLVLAWNLIMDYDCEDFLEGDGIFNKQFFSSRYVVTLFLHKNAFKENGFECSPLGTDKLR
jgi:hypothetical protein